jgi:hypothetical protein
MNARLFRGLHWLEDIVFLVLLIVTLYALRAALFAH